jgi:hypothetical protein
MMDLLARLKGVVQTGEGWSAKCPAHDDQRNSLSLHHCDGRWLLHCHAIIGALGIEAADLFHESDGEGELISPLGNHAAAQPRRDNHRLHWCNK